MHTPSPTDSVRIQLEAGAAALGSFYASPLSSGISNMIKLLQPTMTGTFEIILIKEICASFICSFYTQQCFLEVCVAKQVKF